MRLIFELTFSFSIMIETTFILRDNEIKVNSAALINVTMMFHIVLLMSSLSSLCLPSVTSNDL